MLMALGATTAVDRVPTFASRKMQVLNLASPVFFHSHATPERSALVIDDRDYTYAALGQASARVAAWVQSRTTPQRRPPRVGILAARSLETYAGILGTAWAGGTYVPLNPRQPSARLGSIIGRAGLDALIVDRRGSAHLADLGAAVSMPVLAGEGGTTSAVTGWEDLDGQETLSEPVAVGAEHVGYIMFTSGTTGVPKGVMVTVANVAHFLAYMGSLYHIGPDDRVSQFFETSFDVSVFEMFACWQGGASLHVVPETKLMAPAGFIRQQGLSVWSSVPSVVLLATRLNNQLLPGSLPSLRASFFIGEALPVASAKAWRAAAPNSVLDNQYGPTEATVACLFHRVTDPPTETPGRGTVAIGRPFAGTDAAIVGPEGTFLGAGEVGELALFGPQVAAGYLGDPAQTARRFPLLEHPRLGRSRWYLTGDLAVQDERGLFHCLGRVDNQVKVLGNRVELEDVEAHLRAVCGTDMVAAVAWPIVAGHAEGIVAFVAGSALAPPEVKRELRDRVPVYMVPSRVVPIDSLPLSANGKVDRHALRARLAQAS
jgi:D-alanine--poly(phosphoribitol) ligase subunit 1